jgi:hypothetical protein
MGKLIQTTGYIHHALPVPGFMDRIIGGLALSGNLVRGTSGGQAGALEQATYAAANRVMADGFELHGQVILENEKQGYRSFDSATLDRLAAQRQATHALFRLHEPGHYPFFQVQQVRESISPPQNHHKSIHALDFLGKEVAWLDKAAENLPLPPPVERLGYYDLDAVIEFMGSATALMHQAVQFIEYLPPDFGSMEEDVKITINFMEIFNTTLQEKFAHWMKALVNIQPDELTAAGRNQLRDRYVLMDAAMVRLRDFHVGEELRFWLNQWRLCLGAFLPGLGRGYVPIGMDEASGLWPAFAAVLRGSVADAGNMEKRPSATEHATLFLRKAGRMVKQVQDVDDALRVAVIDPEVHITVINLNAGFVQSTMGMIQAELMSNPFFDGAQKKEVKSSSFTGSTEKTTLPPIVRRELSHLEKATSVFLAAPDRAAALVPAVAFMRAAFVRPAIVKSGMRLQGMPSQDYLWRQVTTYRLQLMNLHEEVLVRPENYMQVMARLERINNLLSSLVEVVMEIDDEKHSENAFTGLLAAMPAFAAVMDEALRIFVEFDPPEWAFDELEISSSRAREINRSISILSSRWPNGPFGFLAYHQGMRGFPLLMQSAVGSPVRKLYRDWLIARKEAAAINTQILTILDLSEAKRRLEAANRLLVAVDRLLSAYSRLARRQAHAEGTSGLLLEEALIQVGQLLGALDGYRPPPHVSTDLGLYLYEAQRLQQMLGLLKRSFPEFTDLIDPSLIIIEV